MHSRRGTVFVNGDFHLVSSTFQTVRCRYAAGTKHTVRSRIPAPGAGPHRPSGKHPRGNGQLEIPQFAEHALSMHSGGQIACSLGKTNCMFATPVSFARFFDKVRLDPIDPIAIAGNPCAVGLDGFHQISLHPPLIHNL